MPKLTPRGLNYVSAEISIMDRVKKRIGTKFYESFKEEFLDNFLETDRIYDTLYVELPKTRSNFVMDIEGGYLLFSELLEARNKEYTKNMDAANERIKSLKDRATRPTNNEHMYMMKENMGLPSPHYDIYFALSKELGLEKKLLSSRKKIADFVNARPKLKILWKGSGVYSVPGEAVNPQREGNVRKVTAVGK
ncbi:MAG: hypothetical protein GOV00_00695 [Candidatus Altiarchaeota archaeon]|nr:hypothetical protein [Candidatus Altiarchaeota archaeon]